MDEISDGQKDWLVYLWRGWFLHLYWHISDSVTHVCCMNV